MENPEGKTLSSDEGTGTNSALDHERLVQERVLEHRG